jgi:hypothetical protein
MILSTFSCAADTKCCSFIPGKDSTDEGITFSFIPGKDSTDEGITFSFIPGKDSTDEGITFYMPFSIASAAASNSCLSRV